MYVNRSAPRVQLPDITANAARRAGGHNVGIETTNMHLTNVNNCLHRILDLMPNASPRHVVATGSLSGKHAVQLLVQVAMQICDPTCFGLLFTDVFFVFEEPAYTAPPAVAHSSGF